MHASACAMDKAVAKHLFRDVGILVARDMALNRQDGGPRHAAKHLGLGVVVKPFRQGSALGVSLQRDIVDLEAALLEAFSRDDRVLVGERNERDGSC